MKCAEKNHLLSLLQTLFSRASFEVLVTASERDAKAGSIAAVNSASFAALHSALTLLGTAAIVPNTELQLAVFALLSHQSSLSAAAAAAAQHSVLGAVFRLHAFPSLVLGFVSRLRGITNPSYSDLLQKHVIAYSESILAAAKSRSTSDVRAALCILLELVDRSSTPAPSTAPGTVAPETASLSRTALVPTDELRINPAQSALPAYIQTTLSAFASSAVMTVPTSPTDPELLHVWATLQLLPFLPVPKSDIPSSADTLILLERTANRCEQMLKAAMNRTPLTAGSVAPALATAAPAPSVVDTLRWLLARCLITSVHLVRAVHRNGIPIKLKPIESIWRGVITLISGERTPAGSAGSAVVSGTRSVVLSMDYTHPAWLSVLNQLFELLHTVSTVRLTVSHEASGSYAKVSDFWLSLQTAPAQRQLFQLIGHNLSSPSPDRRRLTIAVLAQFAPQPYLTAPLAPNSAGTTTAPAASASTDSKLPAVAYHSTAQNASTDSTAPTNTKAAVKPVSSGGGSRKALLTGTSPLLAHCREILFSAVSLDEEKNITRFVRQIELMIASRQLPMDYVTHILPHFLLGTLRIRFSLLWKDIQSAISALAVHYPAACWPVYIHYLRVTASEGMTNSLWTFLLASASL